MRKALINLGGIGLWIIRFLIPQNFWDWIEATRFVKESGFPMPRLEALVQWALILGGFAVVVIANWQSFGGVLMRRLHKVEPAGVEEATHVSDAKYISVRDAYDYVLNKSERRAKLDRQNKNNVPKPFPPVTVVIELTRAAKDGEIQIYGRKNGSGSHELIPQTYWMSASLDMVALFSRLRRAVLLLAKNCRDLRYSYGRQGLPGCWLQR